MKIDFTEIQISDLPVIKSIYDFYILNSVATFHTEKITLRELQEILPISHPKYESFLIKYEGEICGYCYLGPYKNRQAYNRSAEITIYLKPEYTGKGIGKVCMQKMEEIALTKQIKVLIGIITGENTTSIKLFENCGYEKCAHFQQIGEKFDRVLDVVAYQKIIAE